MHRLDTSILEAFRRDPSRNFSTTDMVREVFPNEHATLNRHIHSSDKRTVRKGYALKAKLHRKLLYHANKLVEQGLLAVAGTHGKGEKLFRLAMDEGELVVQGRTSKIIISKPASISTQIDGYEKDGAVRKYEGATWLNKENAILLDSHAFRDLDELQQRLQQVFPGINDAIAIDRFEHQLDRASPTELERFLTYLALDAHDYDVAAALLIDLNRLENEEALLGMVRGPALQREVSIIFSITTRALNKRERLIRKLVENYKEMKQKLSFKNDSVHRSPVLFGRAGPYSFTDEDWKYYLKNVRGRSDGCVVGQMSLVVDINNHFSNGGTITSLREVAERAAHAFFEVEEQRRKHFGEYFGTLATRGLDASKEFFKTGRSYIRFWNYDWEASEEHILELLDSVKEEVDRFSTMQETIFKSCGLPIRFRVGLSTSFAKFDQDLFSERRYRKTAIGSLKELQGAKMKEYLRIRERLCKTFDGADRLRIFIARSTPTDETLRIARYLLSAYNLPSFTLDFRGKAGELKLTTFMEEH